MASKNTDFLRFSAYSIKDLIIRKLSEDTKFTDQIYEGSNIQILIDLVSYMYQCLIYQLNSAASESMFSDTQIYENISRLVNMLGYNPKGIVPSSGTFFFNNIRYNELTYVKYVIPRYAFIDTKRTDANGNSIYYSVKKSNEVDSDQYYKFHMYNGKWKLYNTVFTASGSEYETFDLKIGSYLANEKYVADRCVDVYIEENGEIEQWEQVDNMFINLSRDVTTDNTDVTLTNTSQYGIFGSDKKIFSLRLTENKEFQIKFGNGTIGRKLKEGSRIYVFYLDTNGLYGRISQDAVASNDVFLQSAFPSFGLTEETLKKMFTEYSQTLMTDSLIKEEGTAYIQLENTTTIPSGEEDIESIRRNAPNYYKLGNRLVTNADYEFYVKSQDHVIDCVCQNNWEYISDFYKWLYYHGTQKHGDPMYYISEQKMNQLGYKYSDPADSNNIYIWTKMDVGEIVDVSDEWKTNMASIKTNTTDITFLEPVTVNFAICAADEYTALGYFDQDNFDENQENYVEITIDNNSTYVNAVIQTEVRKVIEKYFETSNMKLGQVVQYNNMIDEIMSINGVNRIRTIWQDPNDENNVNIREGLCFASWSYGVIDSTDDFEISNAIKKIENFQFPTLYKTPTIKVIKKSINSTNRIKY